MHGKRFTSSVLYIAGLLFTACCSKAGFAVLAFATSLNALHREKEAEGMAIDGVPKWAQVLTNMVA